MISLCTLISIGAQERVLIIPLENYKVLQHFKVKILLMIILSQLVCSRWALLDELIML